jgi:hypothetical protein
MNPSPSLQEKLKAQRAEQRRQDRLARLRAQRTEQARAEERRQELRRLAAQQAQDQRTEQTKKEAMIEQLLAQLRDGRKIEARFIDQRSAAQEARRQQQLGTKREQQRQETKASQQQAAQQAASQAERQDQTRAADRARQARLKPLTQQRRERRPEDRSAKNKNQATQARAAQLQSERREERRDEQRTSQQQEQQRENQFAQSRDQRRQQQQDEARRAGRSDQQQSQQADARTAQRRDDERQERQDRDRGTRRQADLHQARLDDRGEQQRQERADEARAAQLQDGRREERRSEVLRAQRQALLRNSLANAQREQRQAQDNARQRAEALRAQEVERRRSERQTLAANQQRRSDLRAAAGSTRAQQAIAERASENLLWLRTQKNRVIDENEQRVDLRGVNVVGLDEVSLRPGQTLREALALDTQGLAILTDLWGVNIVRLPFHAQTVLAGNESLSASALLAELDGLIGALAGAGAYTLLALQAPSTENMTPLPDANTFRCWRLLATHFQDEPGVLYEIYSASSPFLDGWPEAANQLIGEIRREHPAALIFVSGAGAGVDTSGLPLRFATDDPVHDLIYTVRFAPQRSPARNDPQFRSFAQSYPVFASEWSDSGLDLGRSSETVGQLLERYGIGWTALNWNAEPRLVRNAAAHQFTATRFGNIIRRALTLPVKPQIIPFPRF